MSPLAGLALATAVFVGGHFLLSHPLRGTLVRRMGEKGFLGLYSLIAFAAMLGMIFAWRAVPQTYPYWIAPSLAWWAGSFVTLFALILLIGSFVRNPAFPHPGAGSEEVRPASGVFAITRHPMNWAFILWALVHIALWGSPRNLIVAGGILVLALFGSIGQDRRKPRTEGARWEAWMARTSFIPFAGLFSGRTRLRALWPGWRVVLAGLLVWLLVTWWHAPTVSVIDTLVFIFDRV